MSIVSITLQLSNYAVRIFAVPQSREIGTSIICDLEDFVRGLEEHQTNSHYQFHHLYIQKRLSVTLWRNL